MRTLLLSSLLLLVPAAALAQHQHDHAAATPVAGSVPTLVGQDAYEAIAEVVRLLEADPHTDWSTVNLEALRQHLRDMHLVTLDSDVTQRMVDGGVEADATGQGRTLDALRRMVRAHAGALNALPGLTATVTDLPSGMRLRVVATDATDSALVARLRGLGFIGLMTLGDHHQPHHIAIARGQPHQ